MTLFWINFPPLIYSWTKSYISNRPIPVNGQSSNFHAKLPVVPLHIFFSQLYAHASLQFSIPSLLHFFEQDPFMWIVPLIPLPLFTWYVTALLLRLYWKLDWQLLTKITNSKMVEVIFEWACFLSIVSYYSQKCIQCYPHFSK